MLDKFVEKLDYARWFSNNSLKIPPPDQMNFFINDKGDELHLLLKKNIYGNQNKAINIYKKTALKHTEKNIPLGQTI